MKTKARTLLIIVAITLVLFASGFLVLFFLIPDSDYQSLGVSLSSIDEKIERGYYDQAQDELLSLQEDYSSTAWLMIQKRAVHISSQINNYSCALTVGRQANKDYPGNQEILVFYIYALMRDAQYKEAWNLAQNITDKSFNNIRSEAYLHYVDIFGEAISDQVELNNQLINPQGSNEFLYLANSLNNSDYALNAALEMLKDGQPEQAGEIISTYPSLISRYPEAVTLIFYDSGLFEEAVDILETKSKTAEDLMILADLYLINYQKDQAFEVYQRIMELYPDFSWQAYINASWIAEESDKNLAENILRLGLGYFNNGRILVSLVDLLLEDSPDNAEILLKNYLQEYPDDPDASLLMLNSFAVTDNIIDFEAYLWNLFNTNPDNSGITSYLIWYLIGIRDFESALIVCDRYENLLGERDWLLIYRGICSAVNSNYEQAVSYFQQAYTLGRSWIALYNNILILKSTKNYNQALEMSLLAESLMPESTSLEKKAAFHTTIGEIYYLKGDSTSAKRELRYALDSNPGYLKADLLMSLILQEISN